MPVGRPRKKVDLEQLEKLAAVGCQEGEMAWFFGMHPVVFSRNKTKAVQAAIDKGRENGRSALRRKQFEVALSGNPTMLIWLGKQELGQTDLRKVEKDVKIDQTTTHIDEHAGLRETMERVERAGSGDNTVPLQRSGTD